MLPLTADAEPQTYYLLLFGRKGFQYVGGFVTHVSVDNSIDRGTNPSVFYKIAESGLTITATAAVMPNW